MLAARRAACYNSATLSSSITASIAVISDVHANLQALEAVLADIGSLGIEEVLVNGDVVNRGPNNVAVLERLLALGYPMTLGNHDDLVRKWIDRDESLPEVWFDDPFWEGTAWSARQLEDAELIDVFRDLPMIYKVEKGDAPSLLLSHGSPRHYREGYGKYLSDEDIAEIVQHNPADVLIGSHTHRQMERHWGPYTVLNTGAVGTPFNGDPRAQYLVMRLNEAGREEVWTPEFRAVSYDREAALRDFETSGYLEEGGLSARIFYEELRTARAIYSTFWMWSEQQGRTKDWSGWHAFREAHAEKFSFAEIPAPAPSSD